MIDLNEWDPSPEAQGVTFKPISSIRELDKSLSTHSPNYSPNFIETNHTPAELKNILLLTP